MNSAAGRAHRSRRTSSPPATQKTPPPRPWVACGQERFFAAAREGELETLESLLAEDITLHGDGGGRAPALARALYGRRRVARRLVSWLKLGRRSGGIAVRPTEINGQPGAVITDTDGGLISVWSLDIAEDRVQSIRSVANPDKLAHLGPVQRPPSDEQARSATQG